ncbi:MAG: hypothetical protein CSA33_07915 [Desulfobulbus propionicus]|nr:MAG: hypothetical protein CSA33_07915 [Desulfobulbus propionicus]
MIGKPLSRHLHAQLFGRKNKQLSLERTVTLLPQFDMPETAAPEEEVEVPSHTCKEGGRKPRVEKVHEIEEADKLWL